MHNIAKGFDAGSDAEFTHFLRYSRRSASESKKLANGFIGYLRRSNS